MTRTLVATRLYRSGGSCRRIWSITIERAGLRIDMVRGNDQYRFLSDSAINATRQWGVKSVSLLAYRP